MVSEAQMVLGNQMASEDHMVSEDQVVSEGQMASKDQMVGGLFCEEKDCAIWPGSSWLVRAQKVWMHCCWLYCLWYLRELEKVLHKCHCCCCSDEQESLQSPSRRLVRDSRKNGLSLASAGRFSWHNFFLFNDCFVHLQVQSSVHTVWPARKVRLLWRRRCHGNIWVVAGHFELNLRIRLCWKTWLKLHRS